MAEYGSLPHRSGTTNGDLSQRVPHSSFVRNSTFDVQPDGRSSPGFQTIFPTQDAFVELIFVHGLRGDQKLSWTYDANDSLTFWPLWLTEEAGFSHVRIHNFGYNAESADRRVLVSKLNEFGIVLCEKLSVNPYLKKDVHNPIIFIAHSLGGLVVKAAINYAKRHNYVDLSRRFHTVLFLATPHRGADNMTMLNRIIRATTTSPSLMNNGPDPSATVVESINEDFRFHHHGLRLWSFFETLPTSHVGIDLVVDRSSAVLDIPEEHKVMLAATHVSASRYSSTSDPSYIMVRDTLRKAINDIEEELQNPEKINEQLRNIAAYLEVSDAEQDEFHNKSQERVEGTCDWLLEERDFMQWRDATPPSSSLSSDLLQYPRPSYRQNQLLGEQASRVYWLQGPPGSGKSFLTTNIISHLREDRDCSFYFLKHADQSKQNVAALLKSLAYQMARRNIALRRWLLALAHDNTLVAESNDFRAVWKQLFVQKIFQLDMPKRQYWVIDAIDEGRGGVDLIGLFAQIPKHLPYSIFLSSRKDPRLEQAMRQRKLSPIIHDMTLSTSLRDIATYLEANNDLLPVSEPADLHILIDRLVKTSRGSFLWTSLVLKTLSESWTKRDRERILRSVPDGMQNLYNRILMDMANSGQLELPKAMLRWTVCSMVPLTVSQFREAVQLDIEDEISRIEEAITRTCGQLITVEQNHVHIVHDTVREFLLDPVLDNEFAMKKPETHAIIATICLKYLSTAPQRVRSRNMARYRGLPNTDDGSFREYASRYFSEHVVKSIPNESDSPLSELLHFLQTSTLSWIEYCAQQKDLPRLTLAGKNLKSYVQQRMEVHAPISEDMKIVQEWSADLIHLVTSFGKFILAEPSSIHSIIPPLCPKSSRIFRTFGGLTRGIEVVGRSVDMWSDLLSSSRFEPDYLQTLACCERYFAIGARSGLVAVLSSFTCQEEWRFSVGESVKHVEFAQSPLHPWLVVCTRSKMLLMDYESRRQLWETPLQSEVITVSFTAFAEEVGNLKILTVTKTLYLETYAPPDGKCENRVLLGGDSSSTARRSPPREARISDELGTVALVWRNEPVEVYSIDNVTRVRYADYSSSVKALTFNPALNMIATASFDGELSIIGLWNLQKVRSIPLVAYNLATTTDGKTLIAGTNAGTIKILDFESLNLLHTLPCSEEGIVSILFTGNGLRFLDIRQQILYVWEPSALVRRKDSDRSTSTSASEIQTYSTAPSQLVQTYLAAHKNMITTMVAHGSGRYVFCGKQDGHVTVYDILRSAKQVQGLFDHGRSAVTCLDWNEGSGLLTSCDTANRVMIHSVTLVRERSPTGTRERLTVKKILDQHLKSPEPVRQVICSVPQQYLLVSTTRTDHVWKLDGTHVTSQSCDHSMSDSAASRKWALHPDQKRRFVSLQATGMQSIEWGRTSDEVLVFNKMQIDVRASKKLELNHNNIHVAHFDGGGWIARDDNERTGSFVWIPPSSNPSSAVSMLERLEAFGSHIQSIIGVFGAQLVFLGVDGWFRSLRLDDNAGIRDAPLRRFPLPHCWTLNNDRQTPLAIVTRQGDILVAAADDLVAVQRGLVSGGL